MIKQDLGAVWRLRAVGDSAGVPDEMRGASIEARVPGCVHTALLAAAKIDDPYRAMNEEKLRWIGETDWEYSTSFEADGRLFKQERIDLACDGLDTVATVELNGVLVGTTQNMHRRYRFDVRPALKKGRNELRITFASPVKYAWAMREKLGARPWVNGIAGPFNFIRKMACNFGWDWGPGMPTSGIWKGVRLEGWSKARIAEVRPVLMGANALSGVVSVAVRLERATKTSDANDCVVINASLKWSGREETVTEGTTGTTEVLTFNVQRPELWWPVGHGAQPSYELAVEVEGETYAARIGLRTVELDTSPDEIGRKFTLKVNGKPIFCRGFNWIPDDCFVDRATEPRRVRKRIEQAVAAGGNMLRVWGGGIYETDDFYSICDELGVMVWQDFPFACAMYTEEEPFWGEVEAEARDNVSRLASHPSLALWNGCNENIWAYCNWGWRDHADVKGKTWGKNYYLNLLPRVMKEVDPNRPYWAASPWSGDEDVENGLAPNLSTHGNKHAWEGWAGETQETLRKFAPRFCSEFGFQGPATWAGIASMVPANALDFGSAEMRHRQKSGDRVREDGDRRMIRHLLQTFELPGARELLEALGPTEPGRKPPEIGCELLHAAKNLPSPVAFDDVHYLLQLNQCRAMHLAVEWFRSRQPVCMGTLYWQLNDTWPGSPSWSCVDGDGRIKPLWYATRRFFGGRLLTIQPEGDALVLYANNDSDEAWAGEVVVRRMRFDGEVRGRCDMRIDAAARTNQRVGVLPQAATAVGDRSREFIVADAPGARASWYFAPDRELAYPGAEMETALARQGDTWELKVTAKTLVRDLLLQADRIDPDAVVEDNLITLLPGEEKVIVIRSKKELEQEQLTRRPVMMCANAFGRRE